MNQPKRKYVSIDEIQKEYLPVGKKVLRKFVKKYLQVKMIGGRMYVDRDALEQLLADPEREHLPLK